MIKLVKLELVQERTKVFETNSSSSHSLVFEPRVKKFSDTFKKLGKLREEGSDEKKDLEICPEYFGWCRSDLVDTISEKISYLIGDQLDGEYIKVGEFQEWKDGLEGRKKRIIDTIERELNVKLVIADGDYTSPWGDDCYEFGVDHDSRGLLWEVAENDDTLIDFLTNGDAYVIVDSDG